MRRARGGAGAVALLRGPSIELFAVALLVVGLGVFHVWARTRVVAAGYTLGELQREHAALETARDRLRIELEYLRSPAELDRAVRTRLSRLGMAPPDRGAVLAAGPALPSGTAPGRAGVDGVGHPPRPAEPALSSRAPEASLRLAAAAGPAAAPVSITSRGDGSRGALRAGRAVRAE